LTIDNRISYNEIAQDYLVCRSPAKFLRQIRGSPIFMKLLLLSIIHNSDNLSTQNNNNISNAFGKAIKVFSIIFYRNHLEDCLSLSP